MTYRYYSPLWLKTSSHRLSSGGGKVKGGTFSFLAGKTQPASSTEPPANRTFSRGWETPPSGTHYVLWFNIEMKCLQLTRHKFIAANKTLFACKFKSNFQQNVLRVCSCWSSIIAMWWPSQPWWKEQHDRQVWDQLRGQPGQSATAKWCHELRFQEDPRGQRWENLRGRSSLINQLSPLASPTQLDTACSTSLKIGGRKSCHSGFSLLSNMPINFKADGKKRGEWVGGRGIY